MSASTTETVVESCRPTEAEPVSLPASALETTAPEYLRELKYELNEEGKVPAEVRVEATFDEDCSFATQEEAERVREYVRAASFLGAGRVILRVEAVADAEKVAPAIAACRERARREGVALAVEDPSGE